MEGANYRIIIRQHNKVIQRMWTTESGKKKWIEMIEKQVKQLLSEGKIEKGYYDFDVFDERTFKVFFHKLMIA